MNCYTPQPIDISDVRLPEELKPLVEKMAKNVLKYGQKHV